MTPRRFFVIGALLLITLVNGYSQGSVFILSQPQSQIGYLRQTITFSVAAFSTAPPLSYQWQKDGVSINGATDFTFRIFNLQTNNAGSYTVIVSNSTGAFVTSAPATLEVKDASMSIALHPGVTIEGAVGLIYGIQVTTDLSNTNSWVGLTNVTLTAPRQTWFDAQPATLPTRYYRLLSGPTTIP
jgi:hypothetical protein